ncbi:selenocysteine-specific translation elongation factor [Caballeronia sp. ATUFL_M1_KS5A]|uniref:selenocysteine-specific translation elongation factor n=1 Tax=Caballeronia sp. ATUFL_M1_KS5A TaxID=2921778 RepID=UPI0020295B16|nr:selenocysteine-specific translation elongation factor [Caballeronia sp. ATUFL_M1_KS5A]
MIVATAGHIDHGKTSLIRALTNVDTDRLPEEKARGISIDLGFAYWRPDGVGTISFIDVPGHERFVRNMLAGVVAADFALLVIAADDGVMPQSIEHVQILDLLGIQRGVVAITKCDRVSQTRIDAVHAQVRDLLAPTTLAAAPFIDVSAVSGAGIAALGNLLCDAMREELRAGPSTSIDDHGFRMPIDRAFTVTGVGTVVTGTVIAGALEAGTKLVVSPSGQETRVRGLQSGSRTVPRVQAGQRCALNLAGVDLADVHRGHILLRPAQHAPTSRIEAALRMTDGGALRHGTPVHLHIGTDDIPARVLLPRCKSLAAGQSGIVQFALERPASVVHGDRFVIRDQSATRSFGGGSVTDPFAGIERRAHARRAPIAEAMSNRNASDVLTALLALPAYEVDRQRFERTFNLQPAASRDCYREAQAVLFDGSPPLAMSAAAVAALRQQIVEALTVLHRDTPSAAGLTLQELRACTMPKVSKNALAALRKHLADAGVVELSGNHVRLPGLTVQLDANERSLWSKLRSAMERQGPTPCSIDELSAATRASAAQIKALLYRMRSEREVWRIDGERFICRKQLRELAEHAARLSDTASDDGFSAAQYRDAAGIGRNLAIQLLEFLDSVGITRRLGNLRKMRPDYRKVVDIDTAWRSEP